MKSLFLVEETFMLPPEECIKVSFKNVLLLTWISKKVHCAFNALRHFFERQFIVRQLIELIL